jgi:hypothetical protein
MQREDEKPGSAHTSLYIVQDKQKPLEKLWIGTFFIFWVISSFKLCKWRTIKRFGGTVVMSVVNSFECFVTFEPCLFVEWGLASLQGFEEIKQNESHMIIDWFKIHHADTYIQNAHPCPCVFQTSVAPYVTTRRRPPGCSGARAPSAGGEALVHLRERLPPADCPPPSPLLSRRPPSPSGAPVAASC